MEQTTQQPVQAPTGTEIDDVNILEIGAAAEAEQSATEERKKKGAMDWYNDINDRVQASMTSIKTKDKVAFFQLLSIMLGAGVPLIRSLYVLAEQVKNPRLRLSVRTMAEKVESGKKLSEGMNDFHGIFTDAQIGMVKAGEESGKLNEVLKQIARQAEKSAAIAGKIKGAMIYPVVVFSIMIMAVFVILAFVVPQIMELFTSSDAALPMSTQLLMSASDAVLAYYKQIFAGLVVGTGLLYLWKKTPSGKYHWHNFLLHLPVFGLLLRYVAISRFTRSLSSLINSGIPIVRSLQIDAEAVGNEVYRKRVLLAAEDVSRGIPLAENLTDSNFLFPEMLVSMIAIGEQTAEIAPVSDKIADYYEAEVDQMAANMSKLLEPFIMVTMGVVVGGLILAVMQPIFGLLDVVGTI
jgi:type IV pilus assembly protein PilC